MKKLLLIILFIISISLNGITQNPELRQGGDDIGTATIINTLPYSDNGTTAVYTNDYLGSCGTDNPRKAPDVVYSYSPSYNEDITISLCGSSFDTRLYVFENIAANEIACNDDYTGCGNQSQIDDLSLTAGNTYFIVVDGWKQESGSYDIEITSSGPLPTFEIRITDNATTGLMDVQMREITGTITINTSTQIDDIDFAVVWPAGLDIFHPQTTDVIVVCTNYDIEDGDEYVVTDGWGFPIYFIRTFSIAGSSVSSFDNWGTNNWITIASLRAREITYIDLDGGLNIHTSDGWWFEIVPTGTFGPTDPLIEISNTTYDASVNGMINDYHYPTPVEFTWQGGDNSDGNGYSWENPNNWVNQCGRVESYGPGPNSNCIIPAGCAPFYPRYPSNLSSGRNYSMAKKITVLNGAEINWQRANNDSTFLFASDNFEINSGGIVNIDFEGVCIDVNVNPPTPMFPNSDSEIYGSLNLINAISGMIISGGLNIHSTDGLTTLGWVTVDGNTTIGAEKAFRIEADNTGVGSFLNGGTVTYNSGGTAVVEVWVDGDEDLTNGQSNMHLIGPTVKDKSYGPGQNGVRLEQFDMTTLDTYAYEWDPSVNFSSENPWVNVWLDDDNVPVADGLAITNWYAGDGTMEMEGFLVVDQVTDYMIHNDGGNTITNPNDDNWELVSNPFTSAINFDLLYAQNSNKIDRKFRIYSGQGNDYDNWADYADGVGTGFLFNEGPEIQVGQGFLVQVNENLAQPQNLVYNTDIRLHDNVPFREAEESGIKMVQEKSSPVVKQKLESNQKLTLKKLNEHLSNQKIERFSIKPKETDREREVVPNVLEIRVEGGEFNYKDAAYIRFKAEATMGYDKAFEMVKWNSNNADATMIRTIADNSTELSINALPLESLNQDMVSIPLHFQCGYDGTYTFTFSGEETFDLSTEIWLEDKLENNFWYSISETNQAYTFTGSPTDQRDRFIVHFFGPTGIDEHNTGDNTNINIYSSGNDVYVIPGSEETIKEIAIYNMIGSKIAQTTPTANNINKLSINNSTAYYVVRVLTDKNVYAEKVFIME
jgi:hypothetical protein